MRNDRYVEILRHTDDLHYEDISSFYNMLRLIFSIDNGVREFANEYYKNELTMQKVAEKLHIEEKEARRRRQVIIDAIDTLGETIMLEKAKDVMQQMLIIDSEYAEDLELNTLRTSAKSLDKRKREVRTRKVVKIKHLSNVILPLDL